MVAAEGAEQSSVAERLGIKPDMVVQEIGWDEDVEDEIRESVEDVTGYELLDEDADEVVDVVLLWWRADDGDLGDALVDARGLLEENGAVWVLSPKTGRPGHVEPSEIAEAVPTVGMSETSTMNLTSAWTGVRLVPRR